MATTRMIVVVSLAAFLMTGCDTEQPYKRPGRVTCFLENGTKFFDEVLWNLRHSTMPIEGNRQKNNANTLVAVNGSCTVERQP